MFESETEFWKRRVIFLRPGVPFLKQRAVCLNVNTSRSIFCALTNRDPCGAPEIVISFMQFVGLEQN